MIPLFYFKSGVDPQGKPCKLLMEALYGRIIPVTDGVHPITPTMIAGLGNRIAILPLDRKSALALYSVLQPMPGITFFVEHTFNRDDGLNAIDSMVKYYTHRHGKMMPIPNSKTIRECDMLNAAVKHWNLRHDVNFAQNCSVAYSGPDENNQCKMMITYTAEGVRDKSITLDYQAT